MFLRYRPNGIEIRTPAKLNLFFEIVSKRSDGYHDVETLMIPISLYDTLYFEPRDFQPRDFQPRDFQPRDFQPRDFQPQDFEPQATEQFELNCRWASGVKTEAEISGDLPKAEDNLVYKAVTLLRLRAGYEKGAVCKLIKRIPSASGLAGASSDAAAALIAANTCWKLGWSLPQLSEVAEELGSDIPFFLYDLLYNDSGSAGKSCAAICRGRGEKIERLARFGTLNFVVTRPPVGLSTAEVYRHANVPSEPHSVDGLVESLKQQNKEQIGKHFFNRLQPSAAKMTDWITRLSEAYSQVECIGHQMSGSGSSYFGLFRGASQAQRAARLLTSRNVGQVYVVQNLN